MLLSGRRTKDEEVYPVTATEDTNIKPMSEQIIIGRVLALGIGVLDTNTLVNGLHIATVFVDKKEKNPVRIVNISDTTIKLYKIHI